MNLYTKCVEAKYKYTNPELNYYYTDEDYDNFIMLASAWSAIIRKTWTLFVKQGYFEPYEFWNAFINFFIFSQSVLLDWDDIDKYHKKLVKKINKTSNPKFMKRLFTGMDWKWLYTELSKL